MRKRLLVKCSNEDEMKNDEEMQQQQPTTKIRRETR